MDNKRKIIDSRKSFMKSYIDCMDEITGDELYEGLLAYGMFTEKLPPIFSSEKFYNFCVAHPNSFNKKKVYGYVYFESQRNTNVPRPLGIPSPMKYEILCSELRDNWDEIRNVLRNNTLSDKYKVSRIHIRKRNSGKLLFEMNYEETEEINDYDQVPSSTENDSLEKSLFSMNYRDWKTDGNPVLDFSLGKKYVVKADISQCFPSIYTHAIAWALVGKSVAKVNRGEKEWYNKIDKACQSMRNGETHGLLIGPHSSNLISEILLTSVDKELRRKKYDYIRNIDDYTCYTETYEEAQNFLIDLNEELRKFDFSINHKKTIIEALPQLSSEYWIQRLKDKPIIGRYDVVDFSTARSYLDTAVNVMQTNDNNASAIYFAIKVLGNNRISNNAKEYCVKTMCNLAIIYPYLVPIMDKYVFDGFNASVFEIEAFAKKLYIDSQKTLNYEGISYAIYYALKYNFFISVDNRFIINSSSCICKLLLLLYCRKYDDKDIEKELLDNARLLKATEFDENWLFVFEALSSNELDEEWKMLKDAGVTFLA